MTAEHMVVVSLKTGRVVEGNLRPSSDTPTHLVLYRPFAEIGGIAHTHSLYATAWAQARRELPALGTTHADYFHGPDAVHGLLTARENQTGLRSEHRARDCWEVQESRSAHFPGVLVASHAPFCLGTTVEKAVENASCSKSARWGAKPFV